ncbi:MAG: NAD-dependent epimerase/dehydratase family protein [Clostridiales Family XIII bacterium]|jgi:UDP-2-acetamido-2,6-beta-L-arabino-hexul-4-ose reductase|nr:NAD-dependent epimerase/dehydratase family protein [Clostridiales Family XIII bacterium]
MALKVLITGSEGFIGKNLRCRLAHMDGAEVLLFDAGDGFGLIESHIADIDFIFHLAGVNRPDDPKEFYSGNADLTQSLAGLIQAKGLNIPIVFSSSTQAAFGNDYGKSKRLAEDALLSLADRMPIYVYRLHNVFGKWCRPNYNSVVATFCYNIMHGLPISISDRSAELQLVYIDDIVDEFLKILKGGPPAWIDEGRCYIRPLYTVTLGDLADTLYKFKGMLGSLFVPSTGDVFAKKLFSTFVSYGGHDDFVQLPKINRDQRGSFTELVKNEYAGQVSVSISKPGVIRGNHFHDTKMERFIVVKGSARIRFRHVLTDEAMEFDVCGERQEIVTIPVGYTHSIENTGDEMILLIWGNEELDPERPDTYFDEV